MGSKSLNVFIFNIFLLVIENFLKIKMVIYDVQ